MARKKQQPKLTAKQKLWEKEVRRIKNAARRLQKKGYKISAPTIIATRPKRVTVRQINLLKSITPEVLRQISRKIQTTRISIEQIPTIAKSRAKEYTFKDIQNELWNAETKRIRSIVRRLNRGGYLINIEEVIPEKPEYISIEDINVLKLIDTTALKQRYAPYYVNRDTGEIIEDYEMMGVFGEGTNNEIPTLDIISRLRNEIEYIRESIWYGYNKEFNLRPEKSRLLYALDRQIESAGMLGELTNYLEYLEENQESIFNEIDKINDPSVYQDQARVILTELFRLITGRHLTKEEVEELNEVTEYYNDDWD